MEAAAIFRNKKIAISQQRYGDACWTP